MITYASDVSRQIAERMVGGSLHLDDFRQILTELTPKFRHKLRVQVCQYMLRHPSEVTEELLAEVELLEDDEMEAGVGD